MNSNVNAASDDGTVVNRSSNRSFGLFFAAVAAGFGVWPIFSGRTPSFLLIGIGAGFAAIATIWPRLLGPLNTLWFKFGLLLHRVVSPVVLGLVYITSVVPVGWLMRIFGKDPLRRRFEPQLESYWIKRDPPGPQADSLPRQF